MTEKRVALVTGAGRGIGAACANELHGRGMRLALLDCDGDSVHELALELDRTGETTMSLCANVDDEGELVAAVAKIASRWDSLDVLVNNAARTVSQSVWDIGLDEWDSVLATNLRSVLVLTRLCAPRMRERGWGRVVNLASLAGQQGGQVAGAHYAAAKAGVLVLTKIFARELAADRVTVNAVAPAAIQTPVMADMPQAALNRAAHGVPVGRFGRPEEVAGLVGYLVSDEAGYVTGATFDINGGAFMR